MTHDDAFDLSAKARALADEILARKQPSGGTAADSIAATQVMFYDKPAFDFGFAWQAKDHENRWLFPVETEAPQFVYYVLLRLQQIGQQAGQVLFATSGQGAVFYTTLASASPNSSGVVGLLPQNTPPHDFGSTLYSFAPDATVTLVCPSTAADQTFEGTVYKGTDLVGPLAAYVNGKVVATDQTIVWNADGTATTPGNVWVGDPQTGTASILCPAPPAGAARISRSTKTLFAAERNFTWHALSQKSFR
ncbi:MAG: hypothetical protein HC897_13880 [Thermoanaerobaculia bacterium]|nr:hypothetical protein [Thermoanaerobaculia bacterium]